MKYEKPVVIELNAQAKGQTPLGCYPGGAPSGSQFCETGGTPDNPLNSCTTGPQPGSGAASICVGGSAPGNFFCMAGAGGVNFIQDSCTSGPAPV